MNISSTQSYTPPQRPDSATLFKRTDANGDGKITKDELTTALENAPQKADGGQGPNADDLFSQLDADGDGAITEAEHEAGLAKMDQERGGPPPAGAEATADSTMVETLKKLLEALEKKNAADAVSTEETSTDASAASTTTTDTVSQANGDTDLSTLIEQLVAALKKNGETTGVLRATA